jgi:hypothetical protein
MSTFIEQLNDLQSKVLDTVDAAQAPIVDAAKQVVDSVEGRVPEMPSIPAADQLPPVSQIVDNQFDFAMKVLDQQRAFIQALLDAVRPVSAKLVVVDEADAA